jgi:hypothetical protein
MTSKWTCKLHGKDSDIALDIINALGVTKEVFASKAIMLLAQDIARQATEKMEELQKYEANKQVNEVPSEDSAANTETQE